MEKTCFGSSQHDLNSSEKKQKGVNWTDDETKIFLALCVEKRIIQMRDGKRHKHIDLYNSLEPRMKEMGFIKTGAQMRTKLKHLKEIYFKCKRRNNVSGAGRQTFLFYDEMEQLLGGRPSVQAITDIGIDSTANSVQELTQEETCEAEDDMELDRQDEIENDMNTPNNTDDVLNNTLLSKKRKTGGRNTHMKLAENFAEVFAKKQDEEMQKIMKEQMLMFGNTINMQMANQRQWEKEIMEREHQHQNLIFNNFMKGLGAIQTTNFQYPQCASTSNPMYMFQSSSSTQNLRPYQLSPSSLSRSSTSLSPIPAPSPTPSNSSSSK